MATRATTNIISANFRVLQRTAASYTQPADAAAFTTFLATFTELGYAEGKSLKFKRDKADEIELDTGSKKLLGFNATLEGILLQTDETTVLEYEGLEGDTLDLIFVDEDNERCIFFPEYVPYFLDDIVGNEIIKIPFGAEKVNVSAVASLRDYFDIPQS